VPCRALLLSQTEFTLCYLHSVGGGIASEQCSREAAIVRYGLGLRILRAEEIAAHPDALFAIVREKDWRQRGGEMAHFPKGQSHAGPGGRAYCLTRCCQKEIADRRDLIVNCARAFGTPYRMQLLRVAVDRRRLAGAFVLTKKTVADDKPLPTERVAVNMPK